MAFVSRIYFHAVFGALGGLIGWMLFGVFGDKNVPDERVTAQLLLGGGCIGGAIGYLLTGVEALRDRSWLRFARLGSYGVILGAIGGALGMWAGDRVNFQIVSRFGAGNSTAAVVGAMLARGLGWSVLGLVVGISEGIAARSFRKLGYGSLGGALGGFVGGALFALAYRWTQEFGQQTAIGGALGLMVLGASIGGLSALVQAALQPACVRVLRGWQEGREYPLVKAESRLGRDEQSDIALFRDMRVQKRHAIIRREKDRYQLVNSGAPAEETRINDRPVPVSCDLQNGDRIQLGGVVLRFQARTSSPQRQMGN